MILRPLLTAVLVTLALPTLAQTPPPAQPPTQALVIPQHGCVAPKYPSKENLMQLRGDAYNRLVEAFNRDNKAYGECIKKYVADQQRIAEEHIKAANAAAAEYNNAFVLMQYFGYLRRDPEEGGYQFWLNVLNNQQPNNFRGMVCAFLTSAEYQTRFSPVVTKSDQLCAAAVQ